MAAHAPYIMPDGRSLRDYLHQEREREQLRRKKAELRGKDAQAQQLAAAHSRATSELELAELRAVEAAGVRRRRRWLNEKTLRDMAGPLSAHDMESQFKPAPFGWSGHVRPLTQAMQPEHAALWDNFRNIDPEKEARVLAKWAAHQRESAPMRQRPQQQSQAGLALQRWSAVSKKARAALKRANPHTVLQLELQVVEFFETAPPGEQLLLPMDDSFGRLLVHGLAEFYGLLSASREQPGGGTAVAVYRRTRPLHGAGGALGGADEGSGLFPGGLGIKLPRRPSTSSAAAGAGAADAASVRGSSPTLARGPSGGLPGVGGGTSSTGPSPARGAAVGASPIRGPLIGGSGGGGGNGGGVSAGPSPSPSPGRLGAPGAAGAGAGAGEVSTPPPLPRGPSAPRSTSASAGRGRHSGAGGGDAEGASPAAPGAAAGAGEPLQDHEVTCADVLLALTEVGHEGLNEAALRRYVATHIHGSAAEARGR